MVLLTLFNQKTGKYLIVQIEKQNCVKLVDELSSRMKTTYISEEEIKNSLRAGNTAEEIISSILPTKGNIQSGDFSEILCFYLIQELYSEVELSGPIKWRWKEAKDDPGKKTDVVLFSFVPGTSPNQDDLVIAAEVKGRATNSGNPRMKDAIEGAKKDSIRRLAITLNWLHDKSIKEADQNLKLVVSRYLKPSDTISYKKHFKAVVVADSLLVNEENDESREFPNLGDEFQAIIISIPKMKDHYESTFKTTKVKFTEEYGQ